MLSSSWKYKFSEGKICKQFPVAGVKIMISMGGDLCVAGVVWGGPLFTRGRTTTTTRVFTPDFEVLICCRVRGVRKRPREPK